jgi:hypothetical protein
VSLARATYMRTFQLLKTPITPLRLHLSGMAWLEKIG